jgi:hypothetical protein
MTRQGGFPSGRRRSPGDGASAAGHAAQSGTFRGASRFRRRAAQVLVAIGTVGSFGSYGLGLHLAGSAGTWSWQVGWVGIGMVGMGCSAVILSLGTRASMRIRRLRAQAIALPDAADGDFVLYLRPFGADESLAGTSPTRSAGLAFAFQSRHTQEEELAAAVRPIGKLVAVGRPDEPLPYLGAERGYLPGDRWQEAVLRLLTGARLVLLVAGAGAGLTWELAQAVKLVPPRQLVLLIPMDSDGYAGFLESSQGTFPRGMPEYAHGKPHYKSVRLKAAVYFEPDWTPRFVRLDVRGARANEFRQTESAFVYQLKTVYDALGAEWPGVRHWQPRRLSLTRRQLRMVAAAIPVIILLFILVVVIGVMITMY